jgi:hypothetical protein
MGVKLRLLSLLFVLFFLKVDSVKSSDQRDDVDTNEGAVAAYSIPSEMTVTVLTNTAKSIVAYQVCQKSIGPVSTALEYLGDSAKRRGLKQVKRVFRGADSLVQSGPRGTCMLVTPLAVAGETLGQVLVDRLQRNGVWKSLTKYTAGAFLAYRFGKELDVNLFKTERLDFIGAVVQGGLLIFSMDYFIEMAFDSTMKEMGYSSEESAKTKEDWEEVCNSVKYTAISVGAGMLSHYTAKKFLRMTGVSNLKSQSVALGIIPLSIAGTYFITGGAGSIENAASDYGLLSGAIASGIVIALDGGFAISRTVNKCMGKSLRDRRVDEVFLNNMQELFTPFIFFLVVSVGDESPRIGYNLATGTWQENGATLIVATLAGLFGVAVTQGIMHQPDNSALSVVLMTAVTSAMAYGYSSYDSAANDAQWDESLAQQNWLWHKVASGAYGVYDAWSASDESNPDLNKGLSEDFVPENDSYLQAAGHIILKVYSFLPSLPSFSSEEGTQTVGDSTGSENPPIDSVEAQNPHGGDGLMEKLMEDNEGENDDWEEW